MSVTPAMLKVRDMLYSQVPLIRQMGVDLLSYEPGHVVVEAPLEPNLNTHGTAFGGSLYCVGTLGGWALVHLTLMDAGFEPSVWVTEGQVKYLRPVIGALRAEARLTPEECTALVEGYRAHKKGAVTIPVVLRHADQEAVNLTMSYAAR